MSVVVSASIAVIVLENLLLTSTCASVASPLYGLQILPVY